MQRAESKAAIRCGKKNDMNGFFNALKDILKFRDQNGIPSEHKPKLKELSTQLESRGNLTGEQLCYLAMSSAYISSNSEKAALLMEKAVQKDPQNDIIIKESIFLKLYDFKEEEAKQEFQSKVGNIKNKAIKDDLTKRFQIKESVEKFKERIFPLLEAQKYAEVDKIVDEGVKATGGLNEYNLELFRFKMDSLRCQDGKGKETAQFYLTLTQQNPSQLGYYKYAAEKYLELGMKNEAIKAYSEFYIFELDDIEELDKYLVLIDKPAQIKTLESLLSNKIALQYQKKDVNAKLAALGGNTNLVGNDSDEEEFIRLENGEENVGKGFTQGESNQQQAHEISKVSKEVQAEQPQQQKVQQQQQYEQQEQHRSQEQSNPPPPPIARQQDSSCCTTF